MFNALYVPGDPSVPMYAVPIESDDTSPIRSLVGYPAGISIFDDGTAYAVKDNSRDKGGRVNERASAILEYVCEGSGIIDDIRGDVVLFYADEDGPKGVQPVVVAAVRKLYPKLVPSKVKKITVAELPGYLAEMSPLEGKKLPDWDWLTENLAPEAEALVLRVSTLPPDRVMIKVLARGSSGKWFCFTAEGTANSWNRLPYV